MASWEVEEHLLSSDVYIVKKDDGGMERRFTDRDESWAYYEYLKRLDLQENMARNQERVVNQNQEIIENQRKILESQERNRQAGFSNQPPRPVRQTMDPAYLEWLQFKKDTDPQYQQWKRAKDAAEAERSRIANEQEKARLQKQKEKECRSRISQIDGMMPRYRDAINLYIKMYPIIEELAKDGDGPLKEYPGDEKHDFSYMLRHVKDFLEFKHNYFKFWKSAYVRIKENDYSDYSVEDKCESYESHYKDMEFARSMLQFCVAGGNGMAEYIYILSNNIESAENWRDWGFFGWERGVRRSLHNYWKRYKHLKPILQRFKDIAPRSGIWETLIITSDYETIWGSIKKKY